MRHYLAQGRGGREAAGEWKGREGGGNGRPGGGRAAGVRGAAAGVLCGGLARAESGVASSAAARLQAAASARAREEEGRGGGYIRWHGRPCPVSGQRSWSPPRHPSAAPPCMARHRHLAAPG